jgi:hypothetical protein
VDQEFELGFYTRKKVVGSRKTVVAFFCMAMIPCAISVAAFLWVLYLSFSFLARMQSIYYFAQMYDVCNVSHVQVLCCSCWRKGGVQSHLPTLQLSCCVITANASRTWASYFYTIFAKLHKVHTAEIL